MVQIHLDVPKSRFYYYPEALRAEQTLLLFLNPTQRKNYKRHGCFRVTGSHGTLYRIHCDDHVGNVEWINRKGTAKGNFCAHSDRVFGDDVPEPDHWLAQMLSLVTDEIAWLKIAHLMNDDWPPVYYQAMGREEAELLAYDVYYARKDGPAVECRHCRCRRWVPPWKYCQNCGYKDA